MDSVVTFVGTYPNAVRHLAATRPTYVDCATDENEEGCPILARSTMTRLRAMLPDHVVENGSDLYSNEVWIDA
jgi:hypothetical protein